MMILFKYYHIILQTQPINMDINFLMEIKDYLFHSLLIVKNQLIILYIKTYEDIL